MTPNVFEDLGFSPEEAATLKIKTDLHTKFSLEMLLIYAQKLGLHAEIKTTEARKHARSRGAAAGVAHFVL